jgi:hypothetical protein
MTFSPKANLTYFKQIPTLDNLNGTFEDGKLTRAWALRLKITDEQKEQLIAKAKADGVTNQLPKQAGSLDTLSNRIDALTSRVMKGLVSHGWNAELIRPNPTASGGSIKPEQIRVTQEQLKFPGTNKTLPARVTVLFEKELKADNALSNAKKMGKVISYELGDSYLLHRKEEAVPAGAADVQTDSASNGLKDRILVIDAHGGVSMDTTKAGYKIPETMQLPQGITFTFGAPNGYLSNAFTPYGESEIGKYVNERPVFAMIKKVSKDLEIAAYRPSPKIQALMNAGGNLGHAANDARRIIGLIAGTNRASRVAESYMNKNNPIRNAPNVTSVEDGTTVPPIVRIRGGDTYVQVAFAAFNDKKVDIVTVRSAKDGWKSELVKELRELGILDQYCEIYDPSCRASNSEQPVWNPFKDNDSNGPEFKFVKRIKKGGEQREVVAVKDTDEDARALLAKYTRNTPQPDATSNVEPTLAPDLDLDQFIAGYGSPPKPKSLDIESD